MSIRTTPAGINRNPRTLEECIRNFELLSKFLVGAGNLKINSSDGSLSSPTVAIDPTSPLVLDNSGLLEGGTITCTFGNGATAGTIYCMQDNHSAQNMSAFAYGRLIGVALDTVVAGGTGRLRLCGTLPTGLGPQFSAAGTFFADSNGTFVSGVPATGWLIPVAFRDGFGQVSVMQGQAVWRITSTPNKYLSIAANGTITETSPLQASNGTGNAGSLIALNAAGVVDATMIPTTLGNTTIGNLTVTGTITGNITFAAQVANTVFAGPTTGANATPTFRALVAADLSNGIIGLPQLGALTTKGDLLSFSTTHVRVGVGSDGQVLIADSTQSAGVKWGAVGGGANTITWSTGSPSLLSVTGWVVTVDSNGQFLTQPIDGTSGTPPTHNACTNGSWFVIDMLVNITVTSVEFDSAASTTFPPHYKIEYSLDNISWTTATASIVAVQNTLFTPGATFLARYLRYTADNSTPQGSWRLKQLKVMGVASGSATNLPGSPTAAPTAGQFVRVSGAFKKNSSGDDWRLTIGDSAASNGYRLNWTSGGVLKLESVATGTGTTIGTSVSLPSDTGLHYADLLLMVNATNDVSIVGDIDGVAGVHVNNDATYNLLAGANTLNAFTGDIAKLWGWSFRVQSILDGWQKTRGFLANAEDGNTLGATKVQNVSNASVPLTINGITGSAGVVLFQIANATVAGIDATGTISGGKVVVGDASTFGNGTTMGNTSIVNLTATGANAISNITASGASTIAAATLTGATTASGNVTMSGTTVTCSAALTISNATTTHGVGDRGENILASSFTFVSPVSGTFVDTGLSVTLPAAGTYYIYSVVRGLIAPSNTSGSFILGRLFNVTDAATVTNSELLVALSIAISTDYQESSTIMTTVTVAASKTLRLECALGFTTGTGTSQVVSDTNGRTKLGFVRIA